MENKRREPLVEVSIETKAFINQQIAKLAPYCLPDSGVSVSIEREFVEDVQSSNEVFYVTVTMTGEGTEVESTGKAGNIIEASQSAIHNLIEHFQGVQLQMQAEQEEKAENHEEGEAGLNKVGGNKVIYH